jgi:hypothetical protein
MTRTPEQKAFAKERENTTRFQTYCMLEGYAYDGEALASLRIRCIDYYRKHPEKNDVPKEALLAPFLEVESALESTDEKNPVDTKDIPQEPWGEIETLEDTSGGEVVNF